MAKNIEEILYGVKKNIPLKNYTTYKIGGLAKYFFVAKTKEDLTKALVAAKDYKNDILIIGGGSNLLVSDKGFNGLVIKIDISDIDIKKNKSFVGAGASLTKLAYLSAENRLSGLEWSAGMPGTVGGAIYGNAQAFGTKISNLVESVEVLNIKTLKIKMYSKGECKFSLKNSIFKKNKNLIIISAILDFKKESLTKIKSDIKEFLEYRKTKHPMNFPSAGSVFINPEIKIKNKKLLEKFPKLNKYNKQGTIPVGYLITNSGLSGKKIGNAQISEKHSNFIINLGNAKAKDVFSLINLAKKKVKSNFGISLETEVQLVGFSRK